MLGYCGILWGLTGAILEPSWAWAKLIRDFTSNDTRHEDTTMQVLVTLTALHIILLCNSDLSRLN